MNVHSIINTIKIHQTQIVMRYWKLKKYFESMEALDPVLFGVGRNDLRFVDLVKLTGVRHGPALGLLGLKWKVRYRVN